MVRVSAGHRRSRSREPVAIQAPLTPGPSPAERERGGCGIGSYKSVVYAFQWVYSGPEEVLQSKTAVRIFRPRSSDDFWKA